jgi:pimeloyl-ACP methyl ester carboxylesterase
MTDTLRRAFDPIATADRQSLDLPTIRFDVLRWTPRGPAEANGRDAILLHGLAGTAATQAPVAAALAERGWSVRALDLPGHGWTRWLRPDGEPVDDPESVDPSVYRLDELGRLIGDAVRALQLPRPPVLIGHSWGAGVAVAAVLEHAPIERAVLVDPPFLTADASLSLANDLVGALRPDVASAAEVLVSQGFPSDDQQLAIAAEGLTVASPLAILSAARENAYGPDRFLDWWRTSKPKARVDIIAGDPAAGGLIPAIARPALTMLLGRGHVHHMPGAGHTPQFTHFEQFIALLARILR